MIIIFYYREEEKYKKLIVSIYSNQMSTKQKDRLVAYSM